MLIQITKNSEKVEIDESHFLFYCLSRSNLSNPQWLAGYFHRHLCSIANKAVRTAGSKTYIHAPPRSGKTEIFSKYLANYILSSDPTYRVLYLTYSKDLATQKSVMARDFFVRTGGYLDNHNNKKDFWKTANGGYYYGAGIDTPITGMGFDYVIIDDLYKGSREAESKTINDFVVNTFESVVMTRVNSNAVMIAIGTRWTLNDIYSKLITDYKFDHYCYKALAEENDILGREVGEPLVPHLVSKNYLLDMKRTIPHWFPAMYQGNPVARGTTRINSDLIKYFNMSDLPVCEIYQVIDTAGTINKNSDYFVCLTFGIDLEYNNVYIIDVFKDKKETTQHYSIVQDQWNKHRPSKVFIEDITFGKALLQHLKERGEIDAEPIRPKGDKWQRAEDILFMLNKGIVHIAENQHWTQDFVSEVCNFPKGAHDDQYDAFCYVGVVSKDRDLTFDNHTICGIMEHH